MNKIFLTVLALLSTLAVALPEDFGQPIEINAYTVMIDESTGISEYTGDAEVRQGSLFLSAELIKVITSGNEVLKVIAEGTKEKPAKYSQSQPNQPRFIEAVAQLIVYDVENGLVLLKGDAHLVQGFDSFSGETLDYDIVNDKVIVKGSEDGTKRVKFKIKM